MRYGLWCFPSLPAAELVAFVAEAEAAGVDEVWLGDEGPAPEPFAVLAAAAARTSTVRLGVAVTNPHVRPVGVTAATAQTLAELSDGRFSLGVGAGGHLSLGPFGLRAARPVEAVGRLIDACRAAEAGEPGDDWSPGPFAVSGHAVPLFVGARRPRLNRLASERADGVFLGGIPPDGYGRVLGWARSCRPVDAALYPSLAVGDEAVDAHRPHMVFSLLAAGDDELDRLGVDRAEAEAGATALAQGDEGPARRVLTDTVLAAVLWTDPPAVAGARLAELGRRHDAASVGVSLVQSDLRAALPAVVETLAAARAAGP